MRSRRLILAPLAALALLLGLSPAAAADEPPLAWASPTDYVAVIDAGSSGTRLMLYAEQQGTLVPELAMKSAPNTAGLSSFASNPSAAGPDAVQPLLDQLDTYLADNDISVADVPIALLATAGMRAVREVDPAASAAILASTRTTLEASDHPVAANRILPARQEATLAWVDANALAGTLGKKGRSIGIVEIGGASAQVAFRSRDRGSRAVIDVKVNSRTIPVAAVSYLGLGANMVREAMQKSADGGGFCFPNNAPGAAPEFYLAGSAMPVKSDLAEYALSHCRSTYGVTITTVTRRPAPSGPIPPSELRRLPGFATTDFIGLGSIGPTYADLRITASAPARTALTSALRITCTGPDAWVKVQALYDSPSAFAETVCSTGTYVDSFVFGKRGVGVDPAKFDAQPDFDGRSPAWTSGYVITVLHP